MKAVIVEMRSRAVLGAVLGLALLACESTVAQTPTPTGAATKLPKPTAAATTLPTSTAAPVLSCAAGESGATLVVYRDADDLWSYDVGSDRRRRLTGDGDARSEHAPAFLTGACVVHASTQPAAVELLDLLGATSRGTIVEEVGSIASLDVNPVDGSILYLQIDYDVDATFRLKRVEIGGGAPVLLHTFHAALGRGAGSEDEVSVAWSPDGSAILVVNTHEYTDDYPNGAIYLFDPTGRQLRERWAGTHPRWSPDGRTIFYRGYAGINGQRWYVLDVRTMKSTVLGIRPGTNGLVVSPDGRRVAYDTSYFGDLPLEAKVSREAPDVYAYDLTTGKETLLERGALGPLWISASELIVTNAREPTGESMNSWESLGTVTKVSIGGKRTAVDMTSTLFDSAVHLDK